MSQPGSSDRLPSTHSLRAFEAVARTGSISLAAAELGISIGAVSQQIQKLELQVGTALLERRGRGVGLTARGERYRAKVSAVLDLLRQAQDEIDRSKDNLSLSISALPSPSATWVGASLYAFREKHGDSIINLIGSELEPNLDSEEVDFRISYGHRVNRHRRVVELFTDRATAACSPALLRNVVVSSPTSVASCPLIDIVWEPEFSQPPTWQEWFASLGVPTPPLSIGMSFSLSTTAIAAAAAGRGFVLAQQSMIEAEVKAGRLVTPFDHSLSLREPYFLAWSAAALDKPHGARLRQWLIAAGRARL
jgi:LysR family glycine cleavage system transcriptional activator